MASSSPEGPGCPSPTILEKLNNKPPIVLGNVWGREQKCIFFLFPLLMCQRHSDTMIWMSVLSCSCGTYLFKVHSAKWSALDPCISGAIRNFRAHSVSPGIFSRFSFLFRSRNGKLHVNAISHNCITSKYVCLGEEPVWVKTKKNLKTGNLC